MTYWHNLHVNTLWGVLVLKLLRKIEDECLLVQTVVLRIVPKQGGETLCLQHDTAASTGTQRGIHQPNKKTSYSEDTHVVLTYTGCSP